MTTDRLEQDIPAIKASNTEANQALDPSLARICHNGPSALGINNITVERDEEQLCVPFDRNGSNPNRSVTLDLKYDGDEADEPFNFFPPNRPFRIYDTPENIVRRTRSIKRVLGTPPRSSDRDLLLVKYIDDFNCCEKLDTFSAPFALSQNKKVISVQAEQTTSL